MKSSIDMFVDRKVVILKENDTVLTAAKAMCKNQVGCVVVNDEDSNLTGILTDRDIVCNLISLELEPNTLLNKIIETDVKYLHASSSIEQAVNVMKEHSIRRLPIIVEVKKGQRKCIGLITLDDLIAGEFVANTELSKIVKSQILRKKKVLQKKLTKGNKVDQTYSKFLTHVSKDIDFKKEEKLDELVQFVLSSIVQRLHFTGGAHFISQLPKHLQEPLLDLLAGPNRSITSQSIVQGISIRTGYDLNTSKQLAYKFWHALYSYLGGGETDQVIHQLPEDIKELFGAAKGKQIKTQPRAANTANHQIWSEYE